MTTRERANQLARAAQQFPLLGETTAETLMTLVEAELGHAGALDDFVPRGSYALETGGYKGSGRELGKHDLYEMFQAFLGLAPQEVINEYGMTELSSQFYARGLGTPHEGPPWLRGIVFDPETGAEVADDGVGVLRIFDLANLGSVLAIETQDLAIRRGEKFELIGRDPGALPRGCSRMADEAMQRP